MVTSSNYRNSGNYFAQGDVARIIRAQALDELNQIKLYQIRFCTMLVDIKTSNLIEINFFTKTADVARIIRARAPN